MPALHTALPFPLARLPLPDPAASAALRTDPPRPRNLRSPGADPRGSHERRAQNPARCSATAILQTLSDRTRGES